MLAGVIAVSEEDLGIFEARVCVNAMIGISELLELVGPLNGRQRELVVEIARLGNAAIDVIRENDSLPDSSSL